MANINILDKSIFNRIAAGEVVEKPASVIKELVENSIDAGATNIVIEITDGGIKKIKVSDNGCGMNKENLLKCVLPHATSKIKTADDLDKIGTLGFRGEALSSICACAKVTFVSKTADEEIGHKLNCNGGEVENVCEIGTVTGTTVTVEDLFYCIPARAKFLKKPKLEESEITNIISRLILANPNISFKYSANDKLIFQSTGKSLEDAIYCVYNQQTLENLIPINFSNDLIKVNGYISKPSFTKPNRTYQTLIINKRYVINYSISSAIQKAYEHFLMKNNFPFYVIHMEIPLNKIDVNVHPTKMEVKFEDGGRIYAMFLNEVSNVLFDVKTLKELRTIKESANETVNETTTENNTQSNLNLLKQNEGYNFNIEETKPSEQNNVLENGYTKLNSESKNNENADNKENIDNKENKIDSDIFNKAHESFSKFCTSSNIIKNNQFSVNDDNGYSYDIVETMLENSPNFKEKLKNKQIVQETFKLADNYKIIGSAFNTFIIVEQNDALLLIDQHAAHERILFDKFMQESLNHQITVQPLLVPYILDTNYQETAFILENIENFKQLGFEIEEFGTNCFKISSIPLLLKELSFKKFFNDVLSDINNKVIIKKADYIYDFIAKEACKNAVKANDCLSDSEIKVLLNEINTKTDVLMCPHGRPIVLKLTKTEIEKMFKRIV